MFRREFVDRRRELEFLDKKYKEKGESAVSMMKKRVWGYKSPLYDRSTGQIFLQPLRFRDLREWFPKAKIEDLVKIYAVCDGIPKYLEFFSGDDVEKVKKVNKRDEWRYIQSIEQ